MKEVENVLELRIKTDVEEPILKFFRFAHLPDALACVSAEFAKLALLILSKAPQSAERTVALRKLLESKDASVRACLESSVDLRSEPFRRLSAKE